MAGWVIRAEDRGLYEETIDRFVVTVFWIGATSGVVFFIAIMVQMDHVKGFVLRKVGALLCLVVLGVIFPLPFFIISWVHFAGHGSSPYRFLEVVGLLLFTAGYVYVNLIAKKYFRKLANGSA